MIISQWRNGGLKEVQCKICHTKFTIKNSLFLYLLLFMGPIVISHLVLNKHFITNDVSLTPKSLLMELTPLLIIFIMISLILPYIAKLGTPIKNQ